eukprot:1186705-Rhodomonas_salina.1
MDVKAGGGFDSDDCDEGSNMDDGSDVDEDSNVAGLIDDEDVEDACEPEQGKEDSEDNTPSKRRHTCLSLQAKKRRRLKRV